MKNIIAILAAYALAMGLVAAAFASDAPTAPIKVTNNGMKGAVTFDHAKHAGKALECKTCHHKGDQPAVKCGTCHGAEEKGGAPNLKDAAHGKDKGVCYACHLKPEAVNKKKCADCHAG